MSDFEQREAAIEARRLLLAGLIDALPDPVLVVDAGTRTLGHSEFSVGPLDFGCWRFTHDHVRDARAALDAALAAAEANGATGAALLGAYARGWEALALFGLAFLARIVFQGRRELTSDPNARFHALTTAWAAGVSGAAAYLLVHGREDHQTHSLQTPAPLS